MVNNSHIYIYMVKLYIHIIHTHTYIYIIVHTELYRAYILSTSCFNQGLRPSSQPSSPLVARQRGQRGQRADAAATHRALESGGDLQPPPFPGAFSMSFLCEKPMGLMGLMK